MTLHTPFGPRREPAQAKNGERARAGSGGREAPAFLIPPRGDLPAWPVRPPFNVLVVDGDPASCAELGRWLNRRGYAVALACSHTAADEMRREMAFDLIICDAGAPPHHQRNWIERLLGSVACPLVLVATQPTLEFAMRAANLPFAGCLMKPLDYSALGVLLDRVRPPGGEVKLNVSKL
jgi:DNA-binding NtrC family response regulator